MKKLALKLFKKVMHRSPPWLRDEVVRRTVSLPEVIPERFTFKIAQTEDELMDSFRLVYDAYVKLGYCEENPYRMRATIWHALPTTTTLLAMDEGHVIGTVTVVRDNFLKLPSEKLFDLSAIRGKSKRLAEITSLVINPEYRRQKGGVILFTLLRFMHEFSTRHFGVDHLVVTVHPKDAFFYKSLLLFKEIPGTEVKDYLGAPAVALSLDLKQAFVDFQHAYNKRRESENLFKFFITKDIPNLQYPKRVFDQINFPLVSKRFFEELFVDKLNVKNEALDNRTCNRIEVELPAFVKIPGTITELSGRIKNVSSGGFKFISEHPLTVGEECEFDVYLTSYTVSKIKAKTVWVNQIEGSGFSMLASDSTWTEFVDFLYKGHEDKIA